MTSGALASGVGYAIWYAALPSLAAAVAATVQLSVPVLAAVGGVIFMAEKVTSRLVIASLFVLGAVVQGPLPGAASPGGIWKGTPR